MNLRFFASGRVAGVFSLPLSGLLCGLGLVAVASLSPSRAFGFLEEPRTEPLQSSIHYSMLRAYAVCAGYDDLAETVAAFSQKTDSLENSGYEGMICGSTLPETPSNPVAAARTGAQLDDLVPGPINGCARRQSASFPPSDPAEGEGCFTDRFQGYSPFIHMPTASELASIREWAFTPGMSLRGTRWAGYGGRTYFPTSWRCTARWTNEVIDTGPVSSGTLQALGVYLHSLADSGSHDDCLRHAQSDAETLDMPNHHGIRGRDVCAVMHHGDELEVFETGLDESPLYRTLAAAVGEDAIEWLYDGVLPYTNDYDFPGLYADLLAWRAMYPEVFEGRPQPLPMDLDDPDYQVLIEMTQMMFFENMEDGYQQGPARVEDALEIEDFCRSIH